MKKNEEEQTGEGKGKKPEDGQGRKENGRRERSKKERECKQEHPRKEQEWSIG